VKRRELITLIGGAATWPLAARAQQQPALPVVGFLSGRTQTADAHLVVTFHKGLKESGYIEGQNITTEYRWAEGHYDRLPELTAELVRRQVAVIMAGGVPTALAAKAATTTIPVVFVFGVDPVKLGLVASLNQPGGNITGVNWFSNIVPAKRFGLLHELVPKARTIGFLMNPGAPTAESDMRDVQAAADALGVKLLVVKAASDRELDSAFGILVQQQADAFFVDADLFLNSRADQIIALAARHGLPGSYPLREYVEAGGLMSYGASLADAFRWAGIYSGRILQGQHPADLPIMQSTKFEFVINMKTAKSLGLDVPLGVSAAADEIIE